MKQQRGAAILVAMLVVTLVATLAAGLQWRQWRSYAQEAGARTQSQAAWVLVGALDWARLILREDARSNQNANVDHLGEPWALPLQEAKLSSFLSADALAEAGQDEAYLSGQIIDAQSKINLTNLAADTPSAQGGQTSLDKVTYGQLRRLFEQLQIPQAQLLSLAEQWLASQALLASSNPAAPNPLTPLRPQTIAQLTWLGLSPASKAQLMPHLTILPQRTSLNVNTALAPTLQAALGISLQDAQRIVVARAQKPFETTNDVQQLLGAQSPIDLGSFAVNTQFFEVHGKLRLGDWTIEEASLVQRSGQDVRAVWRKRE